MRLIIVMMLALLVAGCGEKEEVKVEPVVEEKAAPKAEPNIETLKAAAEELAIEYNNAMRKKAKVKKDNGITGNKYADGFWDYIVTRTCETQEVFPAKVTDIRKDDSSMLYSHIGYVEYDRLLRRRETRILKKRLVQFKDKPDGSDSYIVNKKTFEKAESELKAQADNEFAANEGVVTKTGKETQGFRWHKEKCKWEAME